MLFIGSDHRGYELKEELKEQLSQEGVEFRDLGNDRLDPEDDYVDFAEKVARMVAEDKNNKGIVLCGSGVGVDVVANKIDGIRCALVDDLERAVQSRQHEDANMLALPADKLDPEKALSIVKAFLKTDFSNEERHERRIEKIEDVEDAN